MRPPSRARNEYNGRGICLARFPACKSEAARKGWAPGDFREDGVDLERMGLIADKRGALGAESIG